MLPQTFNESFERVHKLVQIFRQNEKQYLSLDYSEADVRKDFIDKFWIAQGWDVNHEIQTNPYEREVKVEHRGGTGGERLRKADYAFLAPNFRDVLFYVEAKKPHRDLEKRDYYFQTIRYGWNSQAPVSVLTDFEQFHVLDCRYKPDIETVLNRGLKKYHYSDYADTEKFSEIYHLFSHEAAINGSLDRFAASLPKPTGKAHQRTLFGGGYQSIDESFLQELDEYREELARSFKNKNPHLNSEELTEVTQRTIDRLVFMRFLEDKLIEPEPLVENLGIKGSVWQDFITTSRRLDSIYNGIIFKKHSLLDSPDFYVDERLFANIREDLAHTNSPYDFNAIPIHILGSIYERFLGKVIVVTDKRARVEEKPEVRKAGGVYYTPQYIVTSIIEYTVGKLIEGKTPEQISKLRFADIACGSGSFLLGVYDLLLRYHTAYYNEPKNRTKALKAGCVERDGALHLGLRQKKDILLNNIYGVDLDAQAVEVAQLSLFLKLLEDETTSTAKSHQLEFRETMLPSLDKNIIHGNALIEWDVLDGQLFDEELRRLYPLDFADKFKEVMKQGGFDAIIGNPPYGAQFNESEKAYVRQKFASYKYKYDSYIYFIERAIKLVKKGGYVSFITPEVWLKLENCAPLRKFIFDKAKFEKVNICGENVFSQAVVNTIIFILRVGFKTTHIVIEKDQEMWKLPKEAWQSSEGFTIDYRLKPDAAKLVNKIRKSKCEPLANFGEAIQGITPYDKYRGQDPKLIKRRGYHFDHKHDETCGKWLAGLDVSRYYLSWSGEWLSYGQWLGAPRDPRFFKGERLLFREIPGESKRIQATLADDVYYHGHSITPFKLNESSKVDLLYLLGVVNSTLISWYGGLTLSNFGKDIFPKLNPQDIKAIPIYPIDFSNKAEKAKHDKIVSLVKQLLETKPQCLSARSDRDKTSYENMCTALDRQIDALVYELYGLTDEEIAIIEAD
jgi:type I restriction-modification system DNA methylase subunit